VPPNGYRETAQGCRSCKEARRKRTRPEPPQYIVHIIESKLRRVAFLNDALRDFDQVEAPSHVSLTSVNWSSARSGFSVKTANRFNLSGELLLAQERPFTGQRNPKFSDILELIPAHWIKSKSQGSFTVRRLLPRVHLYHGIL